jgi:hypothetical protein
MCACRTAQKDAGLTSLIAKVMMSAAAVLVRGFNPVSQEKLLTSEAKN